MTQLKNAKILPKGDKLFLIDAPEMPIVNIGSNPDSSDYAIADERRQEYDKTLSKTHTWEITNKEIVRKLLYEMFDADYNIIHVDDWQPEQGKLYDLPKEYGYKFQVWCSDNSCNDGKCIECNKLQTFAILIPQEEVKGESQDDLWDELIEEGSLIADDQKMKEHWKSKFILTRR